MKIRKVSKIIIEVLQSLSFVSALVSSGALYGVALVWEGVKTAENQSEVLNNISPTVLIYFQVFLASLTILVISSAILLIIKVIKEKKELKGENIH